jgi:hypothetical protein
MAKADDFHLARERCLTLAHHSPSEDVRRSWLAAAESYDLLLKLERNAYEGALMDPPHLFPKSPG